MEVPLEYEISSRQVVDIERHDDKVKTFEIHIKGKKKFDSASLAKNVKIISKNYRLTRYELIPSKDGFFEAKILVYCDMKEFSESSRSSRLILCFDDILELESSL